MKFLLVIIFLAGCSAASLNNDPCGALYEPCCEDKADGGVYSFCDDGLTCEGYSSLTGGGSCFVR